MQFKEWEVESKLKPIKIQLMMRAVSIARACNTDWMLYLDADEFLVLNSHSTVIEMLKDFHTADSIAVNWVIFGTNYHITPPVGLLTESFTKSEIKTSALVKSFVRPAQVTYTGNPHFYNIKKSKKMVDANFTILKKP